MIILFALLIIFILAAIVGYELISKIPPTLHTPLMSGTNAISGITLVGSLIAVSADQPKIAILLGCLAVMFAAINVVGGFLVTDRMLRMFRGRRPSIP